MILCFLVEGIWWNVEQTSPLYMESKPLYKVNLWCLFLRSIYWFWTIILKSYVYIRLSIIFYSNIKALELL